MDHKIRIRNAVESDVVGILGILNYEIMNSTAIYDYVPKTEGHLIHWLKEKRTSNIPVIVATLNNQVIGYGSYGAYRPRPAYQFTIEHSVYVHKEYQGQGVGKMILTHLIDLAIEGKYHVMMAVIDTLNTGSIAFHKAFGFEEVGQLREVGYKFDRWLNVTLMQLVLSE